MTKLEASIKLESDAADDIWRKICKYSEQYWVWNGVRPASWVQLRSYLKEKIEAPV
jgi:hypothetical protein